MSVRHLTFEEDRLPDLDSALSRAVQIIEAESLLRPNIRITCCTLLDPHDGEPTYDYSVVVKGAVRPSTHEGEMVASGGIRDVALTGPELLLLAEDYAEHLESAAPNGELRARIKAIHRKTFGQISGAPEGVGYDYCAAGCVSDAGEVEWPCATTLVLAALPGPPDGVARFGVPMSDPGWWAIAGSELLALLRRAAAGEDPDLIYAEAYANSDHEQVTDDDD